MQENKNEIVHLNHINERITLNYLNYNLKHKNVFRMESNDLEFD